jgi:hypothetical protein
MAAKSDLSKLNTKIDALGRKTAKWRDEVQLVLVQVAYQAFNGNNVDPATRLVKVLTGGDKTALVKWIEQHTPAYWSKDKVAFQFNKSFKGEYDPIALLAAPWWELAIKEKNISSTLDVLDSLRDFIKRMEREAKAGDKTITHKELISDLNALAGKVAQAEIK